MASGDRDLKRMTRQRMADTGEPFREARGLILFQRARADEAAAWREREREKEHLRGGW